MQTKHPQICASEIRAPFFEQEPLSELGYSLEEFVRDVSPSRENASRGLKSNQEVG